MEMKTGIEFYGRSDDEDVALYNFTVDNVEIETWVTHNPHKVERMIRAIENWNHPRLHRLIVGFDIEWRPNTIPGQQNPVAILQLLVSRICLIYQFQNVHSIPDCLKNILKNPSYTFVGVGIENDKKKLFNDHGLEVGKVVDLREMAAKELTDQDLRNAGLTKLAKVILGKDVDHKKLNVTMSDWDNNCLSNEQVLYACVDAYLSFAIGRQLQSWYD